MPQQTGWVPVLQFPPQDWGTVVSHPEDNQYLVTGIEPQQDYLFQVKAHNEFVAREASFPATLTRSKNAPPSGTLDTPPSGTLDTPPSGMLDTPPTDHVTNESVRELVVAYVGPPEPLLATVKRRKLAWFGHVTRHDSLSKTILQGTVEGKRRRGRQKMAWCDNIKEWTGMAMPGKPQTEMHGDRKLILLPSDPPDDPTGRGTE
ncbi:endonuclease-reverse transcriptase [Elysia marginata]|uniref:Endonuclease-reverse transcriptase n=1 Tax=Elysia marginata TaxID=1093978 RepID=A0AAV4HA17_9GAST|nr:endonuclease-reverse transcriptase [Elysia marginata]